VAKKRFLAACLLIVMAVVAIGSYDVVVQAASYDDGFQDGRTDAKDDVSMVNILWGALWGPVNLAYVFLTQPTIPAERMVFLDSKNDDYKRGYMAGYKETMQQERLMHSATGASIWALLGFFAFI
jgi:hypothetical protein